MVLLRLGSETGNEMKRTDKGQLTILKGDCKAGSLAERYPFLKTKLSLCNLKSGASAREAHQRSTIGKENW